MEDGDSTAWYGYVGEALEGGAHCELVDVNHDEVTMYKKEEWEQGVEVDWG